MTPEKRSAPAHEKKGASRASNRVRTPAKPTAQHGTRNSSPKPPAHFQPAALKFLRGLERNNRREWFEPRREEFERELKRPMLEIIGQITTAMADFSPAHVCPPEKCMMRIYRDTRFSSDKSPYKRQVAAWWSHAGLQKTSGGGFYFHVSAKEVVIAAGVYMPEREQLLAIRSYLLEHHEEARRLLQDKKLRSRMDLFEGLPLTRPPKGFPREHPAMDLILCRQWGVSTTLPAEVALEPGFVREIASRFRLASPLVNLLNTPLSGALERRKRVLFPMDGRLFG
ncbi:MAG TPA: DUF2461 domain-containing protein [Acidisarcina sp.]|nr:DUF2461 domain-containing protein [Acidisarcina sp.]